MPRLVPPRGMADTTSLNERIPAIRRGFLRYIPTVIHPVANRIAYNGPRPSECRNGIRRDVDRHFLNDIAVCRGVHVSLVSGKLAER